MKEASLECFDGSSESSHLKQLGNLQSLEEKFDRRSNLIPQCPDLDGFHQQKSNLCSELKGNTASISFIKLGSSDFAVGKKLQVHLHQLGESQNIMGSIGWSQDA